MESVANNWLWIAVTALALVVWARSIRGCEAFLSEKHVSRVSLRAIAPAIVNAVAGGVAATGAMMAVGAGVADSALWVICAGWSSVALMIVSLVAGPFGVIIAIAFGLLALRQVLYVGLPAAVGLVAYATITGSAHTNWEHFAVFVATLASAAAYGWAVWYNWLGGRESRERRAQQEREAERERDRLKDIKWREGLREQAIARGAVRVPDASEIVREILISAYDERTHTTKTSEHFRLREMRDGSYQRAVTQVQGLEIIRKTYASLDEAVQAARTSKAYQETTGKIGIHVWDPETETYEVPVPYSDADTPHDWYIIEFQNSSPYASDEYQWCRDNCAGNWDKLKRERDDERDQHRFSFERDSDAVAFSLAWVR